MALLSHCNAPAHQVFGSLAPNLNQLYPPYDTDFLRAKGKCSQVCD